MRIFKRKGAPFWWATWNNQNGQRRRKSTGTDDKDLAQALAAKWRQDSFMEQHFWVIPDIPFQDALLRYAKERQRQNAKSYGQSLKYRLQFLLDRFGRLNLSQITAALLQDFAEERRLILAAAKHLKPLIALAIDTGGRRVELLEPDWCNVDLGRGRITFAKTKNGENRSIRLTSRAKAILEDLGHKSEGPVFTYGRKAMGDVKTSFQRAREKAGLDDVRFHDLRHTFASRLVQQGVSLYEVMHLTVHKSVSMAQRYAHLAPDFQESAIAALEAFGTNRAQPEDEPAENVG